MKQWRVPKMVRQPIIFAIFSRKLHEIEKKNGLSTTPPPGSADMNGQGFRGRGSEIARLKLHILHPLLMINSAWSW